MTRIRAIALLIAGAAAAAVPGSLAAQSVKDGNIAWQKGDYDAAIAIWRPLADDGDPDALFNLAQAYRFGRGVAANPATAKALMEKAATAGHLESQATLGLLLLQSGEQLAALKWLKQAAQSGEARALLVYGTALVNGDGVTQDRLLGYAYVNAAARAGLPSARKTLADLNKLISTADRRKALQTHRVTVRKVVAPPRPRAIPPVSAKKPAAAPTDAKPNSGGGWRIQLGAFRREGAAQALYRDVAPKLAGKQPTYATVGGATRLQVGPYESRSAAQSACASLAQTGTGCFVVAPR